MKDQKNWEGIRSNSGQWIEKGPEIPVSTFFDMKKTRRACRWYSNATSQTLYKTKYSYSYSVDVRILYKKWMNLGDEDQGVNRTPVQLIRVAKRISKDRNLVWLFYFVFTFNWLICWINIVVCKRIENIFPKKFLWIKIK